MTPPTRPPRRRRDSASLEQLEAAYRRLARKHAELATMVATYFSEAGLERNVRVERATQMADRLFLTGGTPTPKFPECCLIGNRTKRGTSWFCTGVLVHPRIVLTAGHSDKKSPDVVALNVADVSGVDNADAEIIAATIVVHENFLLTGVFNDVAMMILETPSTITPATIASTDDLNAALRTTLVGFGDDNRAGTVFGTKRKVSVDITQIRRAPNDSLAEVEHDFGFDADLEFVAGGNGFDTCDGDSGGPAYIMVNGEPHVAGLTSRPSATAIRPCGDGGIYSRVDANLDFVRREAARNDIVIGF